MTFPTFQLLTNQLAQHFQNKQYAEALELITQEAPNFPNDRVWADYWKMMSAARVGNTSIVYQVADKLLEDDIWLGKVLWRETPSFAPLQGNADFELRVNAHLDAQAKEEKPAKPIMHTYLPENHSASSPLLIALHGNQRLALATLPFWESAIKKGWALALPQSTQAMFKNSFVWDDFKESFESVQINFAELKKTLVFDQNRVVLAGHSMGGLIAVEMALRSLVSVRGFIVNGPATPFADAPEELESLLPAILKSGLRCYFIIGEMDDDIFQDEIKAFAQKLKSAGVPCELEVVPNARHDDAPLYQPAFLRGLEFIDR